MNLEHAKLGYHYLRPISIAYNSPKFMLPIRLGTANADGVQELFIYALTRGGRIEATNYRTVKLPTGINLPVYIKNQFAEFYRAMFSKQMEVMPSTILGREMIIAQRRHRNIENF